MHIFIFSFPCLPLYRSMFASASLDLFHLPCVLPYSLSSSFVAHVLISIVHSPLYLNGFRSLSSFFLVLIFSLLLTHCSTILSFVSSFIVHSPLLPSSPVLFPFPQCIHFYYLSYYYALFSFVPWSSFTEFISFIYIYNFLFFVFFRYVNHYSSFAHLFYSSSFLPHPLSFPYHCLFTCIW